MSRSILSRNSSRQEEAKWVKYSQTSSHKSGRSYVRTATQEEKSSQLSPVVKKMTELVLDAVCRTLDKKISNLEQRDHATWLELRECKHQVNESSHEIDLPKGKENPSDLTSLIKKMFSMAKKQMIEKVNLFEDFQQSAGVPNSARMHEEYKYRSRSGYQSEYVGSQLYRSAASNKEGMMYESLKQMGPPSPAKSAFLMVNKEYEYRRTETNSRAWLFGPEYVPTSRNHHQAKHSKKYDGFNLYGLQRVSQLDLATREHKETIQ